MLHSPTTQPAFTTRQPVSTHFANTPPQQHTNGAYALGYNTTGYQNTASGVSALERNTTVYCNTASGDSALLSIQAASKMGPRRRGRSPNQRRNNAANGFNALVSNKTGTEHGYVFRRSLDNPAANRPMVIKRSLATKRHR
jgi:hypothetical protein